MDGKEDGGADEECEGLERWVAYKTSWEGKLLAELGKL